MWKKDYKGVIFMIVFSLFVCMKKYKWFNNCMIINILIGIILIKVWFEVLKSWLIELLIFWDFYLMILYLVIFINGCYNCYY